MGQRLEDTPPERVGDRPEGAQDVPFYFGAIDFGTIDISRIYISRIYISLH